MPPLSIIVPVYNEERTIAALIDRLHGACGAIAEIVFVDDGSTDRSRTIIQARLRKQDRLIGKSNGGKGSAVREGLKHVGGTYTVVQDADLEYDPGDLLPMLEYAHKHNVSVVYGSRRLKRQRQFAHISCFLGACTLNMLVNVLFRLRLSDVLTCYKMVRTDVMTSLGLTQDDFRIEAEMTVLLARRQVPIIEVPISYRPRTFADGKKIGWLDWIRNVRFLIDMYCRPAIRKSLSRQPGLGSIPFVEGQTCHIRRRLVIFE